MSQYESKALATSRSAVSKTSCVVFTLVNWLDSPSLSIASAPCCLGLCTAAFHLHAFPQYKTHQWTRHISSNSLVFYHTTFSTRPLLLSQYFKIFVYDRFHDSCVTKVSCWSSLCDQCRLLTPCSISYMTCGVNLPFEHPAQYKQSGARVPVLHYLPLLKQLRPPPMLPVYFFQLEYCKFWGLSPDPKS